MAPLTDELRQQLLKAGKCFKCRESGHTSRDVTKCPLRIAEAAYKKKNDLKVNQTDVADGTNPEQSGNGIATY